MPRAPPDRSRSCCRRTSCRASTPAAASAPRERRAGHRSCELHRGEETCRSSRNRRLEFLTCATASGEASHRHKGSSGRNRCAGASMSSRFSDCSWRTRAAVKVFASDAPSAAVSGVNGGAARHWRAHSLSRTRLPASATTTAPSNRPRSCKSAEVARRGGMRSTAGLRIPGPTSDGHECGEPDCASAVP